MDGGVVREPGLETKHLRRATDENGASFNGAWCGITIEVAKEKNEVTGGLGEKWVLDFSPELVTVGPPGQHRIEAQVTPRTTAAATSSPLARPLQSAS